MISLERWALPALFVVLFPILALPAVLGPGLEWIVLATALFGLVCAVFLAARVGYVGWPVGVLALTALIGFVVASDQPDTLNHFCGLALGLLAMGTVAKWCRTRTRLILGVCVLLLSGTSALALGACSTTTLHTGKGLFGKAPPATGPSRPLPLSEFHGRTSVNRNALAATAMMILPIAVAVAWRPIRGVWWQAVVRLGALGAAVLAAGVVLVMQSRSAWLSAGLIVWLCLRRWMKPLPWWALGGLVILGAPAAVYLMRHHPRGVEVIATLQLRLEIWHQGLQALQSSPWFGIGLDYFRHSGYAPILVWPDIIVGRPHAHNFFLQTALDVGLIGLAAYLLTVGYVLWRAAETARSKTADLFVQHVAAGAALSLVSVHVYGLLDAVVLGTKVGVFQWVVCGLVLAAWRIHRDSTGSTQAMT